MEDKTKDEFEFEEKINTDILPHRDLLSDLKLRAQQRRRERELEQYLSNIKEGD